VSRGVVRQYTYLDLPLRSDPLGPDTLSFDPRREFGPVPAVSGPGTGRRNLPPTTWGLNVDGASRHSVGRLDVGRSPKRLQVLAGDYVVHRGKVPLGIPGRIRGGIHRFSDQARVLRMQGEELLSRAGLGSGGKLTSWSRRGGYQSELD
jgi:hypothetical protein